MKSSALFCLAALSCLPSLDLRADETVETTVTAEKEKALLTPAQIDELLAPIALYPDPLIALILPASTFPTDIVLAARYLKADKNAEEVENQAWDDSVKALARYPEVVKWLDENLAWTRQLGEAFLVQPAAVMNGAQRLRAAAVAAGNLKDTPEQKVVVEREVIRIVPAEREVIYVPVYDPLCVYRPRVVEVYHPSPLVTFSIGYRTGFWLSYYCNWGYNTVVIVNRPYRATVWRSHPVWSCPSPAVVVHHHVWRPAPVRVQAVCRDFERRPEHRVARPTANSYVQRSPGREASRDFARRDNDPASRGRAEAGGNASREVAASGTADQSRRGRGDQPARLASANESTQVEVAPTSPKPAEPTQSGRPVADRRNPGVSNLRRTDSAGAGFSAPSAPVADQNRRSGAPATLANTGLPSPSPAPRLDRRDTRTATAGRAAFVSPAPSSDFGRGQGQNSRRSSLGSTSSGTDTSIREIPVTTRSQAPATPRRSDSRRGEASRNPTPVPAAASSSGFSPRRSTQAEPVRGAMARSETSPSGRASRQGWTGEAADSSTVNPGSDTTGARCRR